ncbi:hypothetical protein ACFWZ2_00750 [Streptomyces sp. NPDC059002]|uniref:hypothetical protein n=1 Tax=Streptomyces sp. NPDC059002 TaxID=3346690 RepID=UPI0036989F32
MRNVEIAVRLAPGTTPPRGTVTLRAQVEEITAADAPAHVVSRTAERDVDLTAAPRLTLAVPRPDPRARYTVRVHADVDGSGAVAPEDYVSVRSNPVLTHGSPDSVAVEVTPVR